MLEFKVEEKIAEELQQAGLLATPEEPQPRDPDYADLQNLTYLSCVIKEAMRVDTVSPLSVSASIFITTIVLAQNYCTEEASWELNSGCS